MDQPKTLPVISIVGTTGVGKSQFSIELAKAINGEIINADSMQVYKGLDQITNKHPMDERENIPHHVMDYVEWHDEDYHIHKFERSATKAIEQIHAKNKIPIIIGGTHYYLNTLIFNNKTIGEDENEESKLTTQQLEILNSESVELIFKTLYDIDPLIASKFHPQDQRKLRRALEIYYQTGIKPSLLYQEQKLDELEKSSLKYNTLLFWVYCDSNVLKPRLDDRVDKMMHHGAIEEMKALFDVYNSHDKQNSTTSGIYQVIGFKEFLPWLINGQNDQDAFNQGLEKMKIRTRQYAKYQNKWIRKLLIPELRKEERFNYLNGGKLYLLDATDLTKWNENVAKSGITIAQLFLNKDPSLSKLPQAPSSELNALLNEQETNNRDVNSYKNWQHFTCDICKDKQDNYFVAVGEDNWQLHKQSKRHKRNVNYENRKEERLKYMELKQERMNQSQLQN